uniref:Sea star regeneration-associated protease SRAP n=1 Tax=Luidia foliolata TaxID=105861 RepID=Q9BK47_9ECHI|nr:sea star regeneration-associated protease SRAP [Luidia foliolata]
MLRLLVLCALAAFVYADCGVQVINPVLNKIVGGDEAVPGSWPWQVMFRKRYWAGDYQFCGGTLISDEWAVSAAHCFHNYGNINHYTAVVGAHDRDSVDSTQTTVGLGKVFVHESYDTSTLDNDIALIKLSSPVSMSNYVNSVCLPTAATPTGTECVVTGWGDQETAVDDPTLQQVVVPIISSEQCNRATWYGGEINDNMICAGFKEGGKDSCQGDSGGPFVCQSASGEYELVGVVSWGYGCADARKPGVYAKVLNYVSWINNLVARN